MSAVERKQPPLSDVFITKLPEHQVMTIFLFCGVQTSSVASRVAKSWRKFIAHPDVWRSVDFSYCSPHAITDVVVAKLLASHPGVLAANLRFCSKITSKSLQSLATLKDLVELNLEGCGRMLDDRAIALLKPCGKLRKLVLDGCSKLSAGGVKATMQFCPALDELSLNGVASVTDQLIASIPETNSISRLRLNSCSSLTDAGVCAMVARGGYGAKLHELSLAYCAQITDKSLEALAKDCPHLSELNVYGCASISDRGVVALRACSALTALDLSMCRKVSDQGIKAFVSSASKLQSLNLYDCVLVSNHSLQAIGQCCPALRYLGAFGLDEVTAPAVRELLKRARRLRKVDFGGSAKISNADIESLAKEFSRVTF